MIKQIFYQPNFYQPNTRSFIYFISFFRYSRDYILPPSLPFYEVIRKID